MFDFVFEFAQVATPITAEDNIRRGREAMKHIIATNKKDSENNMKAYRAMYRKDLGWIAFSWGTPGKAPPPFDNKKEAAAWWAALPEKTNKLKGGRLFKGGYGVSHIIAKRDWEAQWMKHFAKQSGKDVAMKCVEVIARGKVEAKGQKKAIIFKKWIVVLTSGLYRRELQKERNQQKKKEELWVLTGFEVVDDAEYAIMESADAMGSSGRQPHPTHTMPTVSRHGVGAADETNVSISPSQVNRWELEKPEYGTAAYGFSLNF